MNYDKENDIYDEALDIIEAGQNLTDSQSERLKADPELRRRCSELLRLKAAARMAATTVDVEQRLKALHAKLPADSSRGGRARIFAFITAAAAIVAGVIFMVTRMNKADDGNLYTAADDAGQVMIAGEQGEEMPLKSSSGQEVTISMNDYRRALSNESNVEKVVVSVPDGKTASVKLPDGSTAQLQPGSRLRFPTEFAGSERLVILEGEAYFRVRHDAAHPFKVESDGIETTVLGTEFNVKGQQVTLINGRVRVSDNKAGRNVTIRPGQQVSLIDNRLTVAAADTLPYVYRRDGYLYYDNMTIGDIMKELGRTYNMTVRCNNTTEINERMRFIAERDKGIDAALELMNQMGKIHVFRKENVITVY